MNMPPRSLADMISEYRGQCNASGPVTPPNDISSAASPETTMYAQLPGDYYARRLHGWGLNDIWFRKRQQWTSSFVHTYYRSGYVLDIGCGNCLWNTMGIPTIGVDVNAHMLAYNERVLPSFMPLHVNALDGVPLPDNAVSMIVVTEFLEHLADHTRFIAEMRRVLAPGGTIVVSVPFGHFPGIWSVLFPAWCVYRSFKDKDEYYRHECGHRTAFGYAALDSAFSAFSILEKRDLALLTLFYVVKKDP